MFTDSTTFKYWADVQDEDQSIISYGLGIMITL